MNRPEFLNHIWTFLNKKRSLPFIKSQYSDEDLTVIKKGRSEKGVAILLAMFFTTLISFVLVEISKETLYEYSSSSQHIHELRAYYAAKAGQDLSLLRIKAYQLIKVQIESMGEQAAPFANRANIIWEFPFVWPLALPDGAPQITQNQLKTTMQETFFKKVSYAPVIQDMGSLIDINNLDSPSKALAESTKELLLQFYRKKIEVDNDFSRKYNMDQITIVINNMIDWIDEDSESLNSGGESGIYASRQELNIPPNQHFKVLSEVLLVEGMNQELFDVIEKSITTLGNPGINVNAADSKVLMSLDPRMTEEIVNEIMQRRQNPEHGPYNENLFRSIIEERVGDYSTFNPSKIPILYTAIANFKIESVGNSGKITKTMISHVYDQTELLETMVAGLKKSYEDQNGNQGQQQQQQQTQTQNPNQNPNQQTTTTTAKKTRTIPNGPPPVVYRKIF